MNISNTRFCLKVMPTFFFYGGISEVGAVIVDVAADPSKKYCMKLMATEVQCDKIASGVEYV